MTPSIRIVETLPVAPVAWDQAAAAPRKLDNADVEAGVVEEGGKVEAGGVEVAPSGIAVLRP
jgi:hypothetical protein